MFSRTEKQLRMQLLKTRKVILGIVLIAVVAGIGANWYRIHHRYKHYAIHEPGMVHRSAWMEPDVFEEQIEKYQFRTVVNLCKPGELGELRWEQQRQAVSNAGSRLVELPMPFEIDPDDPLIEKHIELFSNPDNYPMLVHCQHGVTRTAKALALYDMVFRGKGADESLDAMPLFGREDHNVNVRAFAREFEKKRLAKYRTAHSADLEILRK